MSGLRVIFAVDDEAERSAWAALTAAPSSFTVHYPSNIAEVERLYSADEADAIVTDFRFHNGALSDWITFWPLPAVLLVDDRDSPERVERATRDEAAIFLQRRPDGSHVNLLPVLVRKVVNIRESVARQNAHLQMTEHQYLNLIQAVPDIVYTLDGQGRFIYLNDSIRRLGYEPAKLIGKHFSEIIHPDDVAKVSRSDVLPVLKGVCTGDDGAPKLFDERRSGKRMTKNLELRLKIGTDTESYLYGSVNAYGEVNCAGYKLPEFEGVDLGTVGIIRDVSARKQHEQELEKALAAKEILLKEIHHRVKNNLQVVSSLLNLQEASVGDSGSRRVFIECQTQIQSMAMVHEMLYRSGEFEGVDMQKYFERLVEYLSGVYDGAYRGIGWSVEARSIVLGLDGAIAVALIVTELVSNCFKHAFPEGRGGLIEIALAARDGDWTLSVSDNGVGLAPDSQAADEKGIGAELVQALAAQLRGKVTLTSGFSPSQTSTGAVVQVRFPR